MKKYLREMIGWRVQHDVNGQVEGRTSGSIWVSESHVINGGWCGLNHLFNKSLIPLNEHLLCCSCAVI